MDQDNLNSFTEELKLLLAKYKIGLRPVIQFFDDTDESKKRTAPKHKSNKTNTEST